MATKNESIKLLAKYPLFRGQLPPTIIDTLWHSAFSHKRNPFALCYLPHLVKADDTERDVACEHLKRFGRYGFNRKFFSLRDFGAIQANRRRLIAWKTA